MTRYKIDQVEAKQEISSTSIGERLLGAINDNKKWQEDIIKTIHKNRWDHRDQQNVDQFSSLLSTVTDTQRKDFVEADILRRLRFQTMDDRHERIPDAYRNTFEWVFREMGNSDSNTTFDNYVNWLKSTEPIYWVTGKPGAGKSTLTKYLFNDPRTQRIAASWSANTELISAGFFFWNSGTDDQMSREGLLRTLLHQVVSTRGELIPQVFEESWQNYELWGGDFYEWRWQDLVKFFKVLIRDEKRKFLLFIDGLDEFAGDHMELVEFILEISRFPNVKLCVASRPWLTFEEAFGKRPRLKVETLTRADIQKFVSEKLQCSQRFLDLKRDEPTSAKTLVDEVTGKAQGVFLWVYLVVKSLSEGLRDGDTMKDLLERISRLPSDLEELFRKILDKLDANYFKQASILFQLMNAAAPRPLTVLCLALSEEGFDAAMQQPMEPLSVGQRASRAESVRRRLNSRSKGLLEATPVKKEPEKAQVQYLHRTVKDFLARRDIWTYITSGTDSSFNASVTLCGTYLLHIKSMNIRANKDFLWTAIQGCLDHACRAEEVLGERQIRFLDEMDKAATVISPQSKSTGPSWFHQKGYDHWADTIRGRWQGDEDRRIWLACEPCQSFFEYAFARQLYHYVEYKISTKKVSANHTIKDRTLLHMATERQDHRMIHLLLQQKAKPNLGGAEHDSAWQQLLRSLEGSYYSNTEAWFDLVELFLDHGADPGAIAHCTPAYRIVEIAFGKWDFGRMKYLLQKMVTKKPSLKDKKDWPKSLFRQKEIKCVSANSTYLEGTAAAYPLPDWVSYAR